MSGPLLFLLLFQLPVISSPAQVWLEEAHREAQRLPAESRVYALQRLSVWARKAAPAQAAAYFRESFRAAGDVQEANRRGRIQFQLARDLAESAPSQALDLALEMEESITGSIDWRLAAATVALDAWTKRNPVEAANGLERLYSAGILTLTPATRLVRAARATRPELATQVFQRSLALCQSVPERDVSMMAELIFQSQAMLPVSRELALKTLYSLLDDIEELAKSSREERAAAPGLRALALDTMRQVSPEEAAKLAQNDPDTAEVLKEMPVGFSTPTSDELGDPAPGVDFPNVQPSETPAVDPAEERDVSLAARGLAGHEGQWNPERVAELASRVKAPGSRATLSTALALYHLAASDREAELALTNALTALAELYDSEPFNLPAFRRRSASLYGQLIAELARQDADRAFNLAKGLPGLDTRFEVLLFTAERLWALSAEKNINANGGSGPRSGTKP